MTNLGSIEPNPNDSVNDLVGGEQPDGADTQTEPLRSKESEGMQKTRKDLTYPKDKETQDAEKAAAAPQPQTDRTSKLYKGQPTPGTDEFVKKHGSEFNPANLPQHSRSPEDYTQQIIKLQHQIEDSPDRRGNAKLQKKLDSLFEARNQLIRRNIISAKRNVLAKPGFMSDNWGNF